MGRGGDQFCSWSEARRSTRLSTCASCILIWFVFCIVMGAWKWIEEKRTVKPILEWDKGVRHGQQET